MNTYVVAVEINKEFRPFGPIMAVDGQQAIEQAEQAHPECCQETARWWAWWVREGEQGERDAN